MANTESSTSAPKKRRRRATPRPLGRIRTIGEARQALQLTSADGEPVTQLGVPSDGVPFVAYPVADNDQPGVVAEFAVLRVLRRENGKLVPHRAGGNIRLKRSAQNNLLWIVFGSISSTADQTLTIETLAIGPARPHQLTEAGDEPTRGISAELLRYLSPSRLLTETVENLQRQRFWLEIAASQGGTSISQRQRDLHDRIDRERPRRAHTTDEELAQIAKRYITLLSFGVRHPLHQLAAELGITHNQARDRIHKARQHDYLGPTKQGRAAPTPGKRLHELGWQTPRRSAT